MVILIKGYVGAVLGLFLVLFLNLFVGGLTSPQDWLGGSGGPSRAPPGPPEPPQRVLVASRDPQRVLEGFMGPKNIIEICFLKPGRVNVCHEVLAGSSMTLNGVGVDDDS